MLNCGLTHGNVASIDILTPAAPARPFSMTSKRDNG